MKKKGEGAGATPCVPLFPNTLRRTTEIKKSLRDRFRTEDI